MVETCNAQNEERVVIQAHQRDLQHHPYPDSSPLSFPLEMAAGGRLWPLKR